MEEMIMKLNHCSLAELNYLARYSKIKPLVIVEFNRRLEENKTN